MSETMTPETPETLREICSFWVRIIKTKWENGVHVWPPAESPLYRVRQLLDNQNLQKELFGDYLPAFLIADGYEQEDITFEALQEQIAQSLGFSTVQHSFMQGLLQENKNNQTVLFLFGLDAALKVGNTLPLQQIATLPTRYTNSNFTVILFTELNLPESQVYSVLLKSSYLLQNVAYQPLFKEKDIMQFIRYMEDQWGMKVPDPLLQVFIQNIGGHFLLVKEGIRLVRDNPQINREELLNASSLVRKGLAIFQRLPETDQQIIKMILQRNKLLTVSEYLAKTGLVRNGAIGLPYWNIIKNKILGPESEVTMYKPSLDFFLTGMEQDVLDLLKDSDKVVTREQIAEKIWHENWEDKYSDWAIDQLMHRIRKKLEQTQTPLAIQTKKGEGFYATTIKT